MWWLVLALVAWAIWKWLLPALVALIPTVNGTYDLKILNGSNLPFTLREEGEEAQEVEITSIVITAANDSFTELTTLRVTKNGQSITQTRSDAGWCIVNGNKVAFVYRSGRKMNGTIVDNKFVTASEGSSERFFVRRQEQP